MPELQEIGLDPAVQGVPVKKKLSVHKYSSLLFIARKKMNVGWRVRLVLIYIHCFAR